jgi:hypothetical protein
MTTQRRSSNQRVPGNLRRSEPRSTAPTSISRQDFYNVQMRLVIAGQPETISLCGRCAALVLASERSQRLHKAYHEQLDGIDQR